MIEEEMEGNNGLCSKGFRSCFFSNGTRLSTQPGEDFVHSQVLKIAIGLLISLTAVLATQEHCTVLGMLLEQEEHEASYYMSNGSLGSLLHEMSGECSLGWEIRYRIILGAAQGLAYLHHDCVPPIVHRDIKANNILTGSDFEPYIGDFGLAKLVDDEYGYSLKIREKRDVHSYGVVVLEVLTGKQPIDPTIQDGLHIIDWVKKMRDIQVIDKGLLARPECDVQEMMQTLGVALLCVNTMPEDRPTMRDVAALLSEIRQEREESTKGVENNGCSGSCNNNGGERIDDSSPSSAVQQTANFLISAVTTSLGTIPEELFDIDNQDIALNLSWNSLDGFIPARISALNRLSVLDISYNMLSGQLFSLSGLKNLVSLNISHNRFSGYLPDSKVFRRMIEEEMEGNNGLCSKGFRSCFVSNGMLAVLRVRQFTPFQKLNFTVEHVLKCLVESNVIGKGCSRVVYRAEMPNQDVIAVKKLWPVTSTVTKTSGVPDSFSAEFKTLGSIRHKNIVRSGECSLGWEVRYRIILVEAQGLAYLHHDCVPPIVHRDIKANNILIGPDLEPYIGDFGLAKLVDDGDFARSSKNIAGSYGYITPEMMQTLGVVLLCVNPMPEDRPTIRDVAAMLSEIRQEREESTKGVENNGCSGSCNNNGGERIDDSSPSSAVQQTAKYLRNSSKSFSASSLMYSSFYYYSSSTTCNARANVK
ncbi:hypothetical protein DY000_02025663 [Brassica cretica]|uniref:non-specific serine/threonine protein kinase n=1 Tax=Brassica cretica TaxID=69181 RepID=A0ABQ7EGW0_BRACR|nr:hypothetical protein DY000_02025663 [Brassica cretica]